MEIKTDMSQPHENLYRQLMLLLLLLCFLEIAFSACGRGFWGGQCRYRCRCIYFSCDVDGNCFPNATCFRGYFGPQCQFINMVNSSFVADWAHDDNDTTCSPSSSTQEVTVGLVAVTLMTWFRLHVQNPQSIGDVNNAISVKLNGTQDCINKRVYTFGPTILDVSCDNIALISSIAISGSITPHICNVLISGGTNVAFNQTTAVVGVNANFSTGLHVDGNYYCQIAYPQVATQIIIRYDHPQLLYGLRFVLSHDFTSHDISLTTYLAEKTVTSHTLKVTQRKTDIFLFDFKPVDSIQFQVSPQIEFCELETIGEAWCELGHYGFGCEHPCQCQPGETCFSPTGMCGPGCAPGSYGFHCSLRCSRGCLNNKCGYRSGHCTCGPGFVDNSICETDCEGSVSVCTRTCSDHCLGKSCNQTTGMCFACASDYEGPNCENTKEGTPNGIVYLLMSLLILLLLAICIFAVWYFTRKKPTVTAKQEEENVDIPRSLISAQESQVDSRETTLVVSKTSFEEYESEAESSVQ